MREFELLQHIYQSSQRSSGRVLIGPGDDMGMVRLDGTGLLAAVDQLIDGRHIKLESTPIELVGRKAITRSLSDIAAMACRPVASLASATLPAAFDAKMANALFDAMRVTASEFDCPLIGGDIAIHHDPRFPMVCSITVLAEPLPDRQPITRSGAKVGDTVYVTGRLGGSLNVDGLGHHLTFTPRIAEAIELSTQLGGQLHSMLDVSDGLGRDVSHIAEQSGVCIEIDAEKIPCNPGRDWKGALGDGEDYELCFTASGSVPDQVCGTPVTAVGAVLQRTARKDLVTAIFQGSRFNAEQFGWEHKT